MKLIFTILIVYLAYKIMFKPNKIDPPSKRDPLSDNKSDEGDFIDYEEVD
jgi:uncharacterized membrane protein YfcA